MDYTASCISVDRERSEQPKTTEKKGGESWKKQFWNRPPLSRGLLKAEVKKRKGTLGQGVNRFSLNLLGLGGAKQK